MCALVMAIVGRRSTGTVSACWDWRIRIRLLTMFLFDHFFEQPRGEVTPRVHSHDLLFAAPLREGSDSSGGFSVGEVGPDVYQTWPDARNGRVTYR